jgi:Family of unknown function (DUF6496)
MPVSGTPKDKIREEMHRFKHGQLHSGSSSGPIVKNRKQAIAIAMSVAGRSNRADGGATPWYVKNEARGMMHTGPIRSPVAGRTDHIPLIVPNHSYVLPAQHVSHLGQNNTEAGFSRLDHMFSSGPFGTKLPSMHHGKGIPGAPGARAITFPAPKQPKGTVYAAGGGAESDDDDGVPIMGAGGEYVVHPNHVAIIGKEALEDQYGKKIKFTPKQMYKAGHDVLDHWVESTKDDHIETLEGLPGPAQ